MATHTVNKKRFIQQHPTQSTTASNESTSDIPPSSSLSSTDQPSNDMITRTEITPSTRIVVVRTASSKNNEQVETNQTNEPKSGKSLEFPPLLTNGRTSVYLIRRPIPAADPPRQTKIFAPPENTTDNLDNIRTPTPTEQIITSPSQLDLSSKHHSSLTHPESPTHLISSPKQSGLSKHRSRSARRISTKRLLPWSPISTQSESKDLDHQRTFFSSSRTKNTAIQVNLPLPDTTDKEQEQPLTKNIKRKKSPSSRIKSAKSIVLINPDDQTIAVIEKQYLKADTTKKRPKSLKKTRFHEESDTQSTEQLVKTSRWQTCLGCLSRYICLIIIICIIIILIGLAGIGVSAYFLATASNTNLIPKIVGIAVGGVLVIAALCFLCCTLGCIGSRDGYFSYNDSESKIGGGRALALIPPTHPNARLYIPHDYKEIYEHNQTPPFTSLTTNTTTHPSTINRQKTVVNEVNGNISTVNRQKTVVNDVNDNITTTNAKHLTIEMPERLLTGRKMSPKTHERKLNRVVTNIGHAVEDAKKRYNGDIPNKVIVKIDQNAKPIT